MTQINNKDINLMNLMNLMNLEIQHRVRFTTWDVMRGVEKVNFCTLGQYELLQESLRQSTDPAYYQFNGDHEKQYTARIYTFVRAGTGTGTGTGTETGNWHAILWRKQWKNREDVQKIRAMLTSHLRENTHAYYCAGKKQTEAATLLFQIVFYTMWKDKGWITSSGDFFTDIKRQMKESGMWKHVRDAWYYAARFVCLHGTVVSEKQFDDAIVAVSTGMNVDRFTSTTEEAASLYFRRCRDRKMEEKKKAKLRNHFRQHFYDMFHSLTFHKRPVWGKKNAVQRAKYEIEVDIPSPTRDLWVVTNYLIHVQEMQMWKHVPETSCNDENTDDELILVQRFTTTNDCIANNTRTFVPVF